jgi:hypothetical protein
MLKKWQNQQNSEFNNLKMLHMKMGIFNRAPAWFTDYMPVGISRVQRVSHALLIIFTNSSI